MKRVEDLGNLDESEMDDEEMEEANIQSPRTIGTGTGGTPQARLVQGISYRDSLQRNNPNFVMFDKGIGFLQLKRRLKTKWALKGDFSLTDIGHDYYVTRFTNMDDYEHVMMNDSWTLGDNYVVTRGWIPNFVPEEDNMLEDKNETIMGSIQDGCRFRALANIDLNVEMEANDLETQGNLHEKGNSAALEVTLNEESNMDMTEDILDKENIPEERAHANEVSEETRPVAQRNQKRPSNR
ncbi:hypothetical protein Cgig2_004624 [Carnegiea gigantea]|uniref:DUF4283 domain-containing protein n=1 Tax=Carnegiea gigantea TaxID=171969 RepID=A0A9Q1Q9G5_9CARY|nr:hypothetical protein Cgig2_004624 [Carnegiea gigantea]